MAERRKHKRYHMPRGTFVIMRNEVERLRNHSKMSIGEIAMVLYKSQPEVMGQVTEMSLGGLSFAGHPVDLPDAEHVELDLLMAEKGIYLHNLPYVTVAVDPAARNKKKNPSIRTNAIHFNKLDPEQKGQLRDLLAHHVGSP